MSDDLSFDGDWLTLREPADHRSASATVAAALRAWVGERQALTIVDLGSGTGSTLRALAPLLPVRQSWILVERDPALIARARRAIGRWAGLPAPPPGGALDLEVAGRALMIAWLPADLTAAPLPLPDGVVPDLVTCSALLDLATEPWITRLAAATAAHGAALLDRLTTAAAPRFDPEDPKDGAIAAAFARDQRRPKGLGQGDAAGITASAVLQAACLDQGLQVQTGASDWVLGQPADGALIAAHIDGMAEAASRWLDPALVQAWRARRHAHTTGHIVPHRDLFACPSPPTADQPPPC